jgi:tRNA (uracil-5-)-methyltransferase
MMNLAQLDPALYAKLLEEKCFKLKELFASFSPPELEIFASSPSHYRMRAEFRVWHEGEDLYYYMFDKVLDQKVRTDQYLPASEIINNVMMDLMNELKQNHILRHKLFQVDFLSTLSGEILITLLYHRQLNADWINEAHLLKTKLSEKYKVHLVGRARKQKIDIDQDFVVEVLPVAGKNFIYKQIENSFTQPNALVAVKMLEWSLDVTQNSKGDLLELYCGNGNFSIALSSHFRRVLATELAKPSVEAAQYNIAANEIKNVSIIRMSAEDFSEAMARKREYTRLKGIDLKSYECNTILVDPPRAGLDELTLSLVQQYDHIIYISCNPHTLLSNMQILAQTHQIKRIALFDKFPYTDHMECGVFLVKH